MAHLMRLARSPWPIPFGSLKARRSLLALDNLAAAIDVVLSAPGTLRRILIAADPDPLTVAEMITSMRAGIGRRPNLLPLPVPLVGLALRSLGRQQLHLRLTGSLVANPAALLSLGWVPPLTTSVGLAKLMQANEATL